MLPVNCPPLPVASQNYLERQRQRGAAWKSLRGSKTAEAVKSALRRAFHNKCGYCEQIEAQTIDHFEPQSDPSKRWDWNNYILACDVCQSRKHDRPPYDTAGHWMVNPRWDESLSVSYFDFETGIITPQPTWDEPLSFLYFDFETGIVTPQPTTDESLARGRITIARLDFDRRPQLQDERRRKLFDILGFALRIVEPKSTADADDAWRQLRDRLSPESPYLGMIRQLILVKNEYSPLVEALMEKRPEFDAVVQEWCLPLRMADD